MSPFFLPVVVSWIIAGLGGAVGQRDAAIAALSTAPAIELPRPSPPPPAPPVVAPPAPVAAAPAVRPPPPPAPPAPRVAQAPVDPAMIRAELEMWTRIKDTTRVEEIEAFLAAFPEGKLAGLARIRLDEVRRGVPPPPTVSTQNPTALMQPQPTPPALPQPTIRPEPPAASLAPPSAEPFVLTRSAITEAQERLYSLNYYSGPINGSYNAQTREAIRDYQQRQSLPVTGEIDGALIGRLRAARIPDKWGALAFSARGGYGAAWARGTRRQAEIDAMAICRRNTRGSCKIVIAPGSACSALAVYEARGRGGRRNWGAFATTRPTRDAARDAAIEYCRGEAIAPDRCEITTLICGDTGQQV